MCIRDRRTRGSVIASARTLPQGVNAWNPGRVKVPQLPVAGALIADEERAGRYLRVSSHPEFDRVVLSVWQHDQCLATVRLDRPVSYTHLDVYKRQHLAGVVATVEPRGTLVLSLIHI